MRIRTLFLIVLITLIVSSCSSSKSYHVKDILLVETSVDIKEIIIKDLDHNREVSLTKNSEIIEIWRSLDSLEFISSKHGVTYKEPVHEFEINFIYSDGNEILEIKNQGAFLYKESNSYRIINKQPDLSFLTNLFENE
ncbi:hypothetical protein [Paenibacillus sp. sgz500958]|uniref:hypothetical protein n=1 Tax=Paenibacillus sp. sgz500958 TaxID=3242475 RepID=UPI0036D36A40